MMRRKTIGLRVIRFLDRATDAAAELVLCLILLLGLYSLWDSRQLDRAADAAHYQAYRPAAEEPGFDELRALNPEVIAWLTVDDTPIDYPVTQADNNEKYINTDAEGKYALSGAIFLDYRNNPLFSDFNSILYGHHMENQRMFGALSHFADPDYFAAHPSGTLFFDGAEHRLCFFALVLTDAYDRRLFDPALADPSQREAYLAYIRDAALRARDIPVTAEDRIVLLSTCTTQRTNGRYVLVGSLDEGTEREEIP